MTQLDTIENPISINPIEGKPEKCAAIFDLYGTLINLETRPLLRKIGEYLGVRATPDMLRQTMTLNFPDETRAVRGFIRILLKRDATTGETKHCKALLDEHLAKAELIEGAIPLLTFLHRRGLKLALLSNVAQIFKKPFYDLGLDQYFDVVHFSSDTGFCKPAQDSYLGVCHELHVLPQECLYFGDNAKNDYDGPLAAHMRPILTGTAPRAETVSQLSDLLWMSLTAEPLIKLGQKIRTVGGHFTITSIEQLSPSDLGIYNVVARVHGLDQNKHPVTWYAKRFLDTSSIHVELTAHKLYAKIGITVPHAFIAEGSEPILFTSPAKGNLWQEGDFNTSIAEEVGAHAAAAYIFSNADWRPRNTFLCKETDLLTGIDLEHCLFDRILSLAGAKFDVNDPKAIDALGHQTPAVTRTRVLSYAAVRRARRSFTKNEDRTSEEIQLFAKGWKRSFFLASEKKQEICNIIRERIDVGRIIVGTKSHRRAFASVDLHDLLERIDLGNRVINLNEVWGNK